MRLRIMGSRGIPAKHGGFETFAEQLALYLTARGHTVEVYCQVAKGTPRHEEVWQGIRLIKVPSSNAPWGTFLFDLRTVLHCCRHKGLVLTLGYNTAILCVLYRVCGKKNVINMDGIEWKRAKWSPWLRVWLWANEWAGARLGTRLIADHPQIRKHLSRHTTARKIAVIPYTETADDVDERIMEELRLTPGSFDLLIARPEPENSILTIVRAFSMSTRKTQLLVLGKYDERENAFHAEVVASASEDVRFVGAIYDRAQVRALRRNARLYIHGHQVGGTNPSLVESLAASSAVVAHDNPYNRWVAGSGAHYFTDESSLHAILTLIDSDEEGLLASMRTSSARRFQEDFLPETVLGGYERLLLSLDEHGSSRPSNSVDGRPRD